MGEFSAHVAHDLETKTVELLAERNVARRMGVYPGQTLHFLSVLAAKLANNQLPACTFSTTGHFLWWSFTLVKSHPLQDFEM